jgi:hypothetical protein
MADTRGCDSSAPKVVGHLSFMPLRLPLLPRLLAPSYHALPHSTMTAAPVHDESLINVPTPGAVGYYPFVNPSAGTALAGNWNHAVLPKLFTPITIGTMEFKNRVFVAPMCEYSAAPVRYPPTFLALLANPSPPDRELESLLPGI